MRVAHLIFYLSSFLTTYSQELSGDWMNVPEPGEILVEYVGLRFKDDSLFVITNSGIRNDGKYLYKNDSLIVEDSDDNLIIYTILRPSSDSLNLISNSGTKIKYYSRNLEFDPGLKWNKITFEGTLYNSKYSKFILTLTQNGKADFKGQANGRSERKRFKVETKRIHEIDSAFKWSFLRALDTTHFYGSRNDKPLTIKFDYNESKSITLKVTTMKMPFRLRRIAWYLLNELKKRNLV